MTCFNSTLATIVLSVFLSSSVLAKTTIVDFETEIQELMKSDRSLDEKIEKMKKLTELYEANNKLQQLISPPKSEKIEAPKEKEIERPKQSAQYHLPKGYDLSPIFVSELFIINNDAQAEFYVDGQPVPVNLVKAVHEKTKYGEYRVKSYTHDKVVFQNIKSGKLLEQRPISSQVIANRIKHNNSLREEYQKRYTMGTLDAEIQLLMDGQSQPLKVGYPTVAPAPQIFDSMGQ